MTKMCYKGEGFGVNHQGITNPTKAKERPKYEGLGYVQKKNGLLVTTLGYRVPFAIKEYMKRQDVGICI